MLQKKWILKPLSPSEAIQNLCAQLNVSDATANLLYQRGIDTYQAAKSFFRDGLDALHDPFLMKGMEKAVQRLERAIENQEKILFYGDYDVDGTTSVAVQLLFFKDRYPHIDFYIPDRYAEGYGLSRAGVEFAIEHGFSLIITLDCGIKAIENISFGTENHLDFIVCDHHTPGPVLPPAIAILDAKQSDCPYPYKELTGCGVGFKLLMAYCLRQNIPLEELYPLLDLLAISIACDIVPITGENRIMTRYGLQYINEKPRVGVAALIEQAGFKNSLNIGNLVFGLGPRINAAGRIGHANQAVSLLIAEDPEVAAEKAGSINIKNTLRQDYDANITQEALAMIVENGWQASKSTVLFKEDWHKGVIGIVASRCIEHHFKPTIILTESNGKATGSARSVPGFDVYQAICECEDLLTQFGGHTYAAGLTLPLENIEPFRNRFEEVVSQRITPEQLVPVINVDEVIRLEKITPNFYKIIQQMEPFGPSNMQPVFSAENLLADDVRILKEAHLKFLAKHTDSESANPVSMPVIGFGMAHFHEKILSGKPFKICFDIQENNFRNVTTLQLFLRDLKLMDEE